MSCPVCRTRRVVEIGVHLGDTDVVLRSCSACDTRWWQGNGETIDLPEVIELATVRR